MPELPEVETVRRGLEKNIIGKKISKVKIYRKKNFEGNKKDIINKKVEKVLRYGKYLAIELEEFHFLLVHLKMTGQLLYREEKGIKKDEENESVYDSAKLPNKYTRVEIQFHDDTFLFFNDLRAFGWVKVKKFNKEPLPEKLFDREFGPEPFSKDFTFKYLKKILGNTRRAIKTVIMDQKDIAGVGNIYAAEALFCARIDPRRPANKVVKEDPKKVKQLLPCIKKALKKGIKYSGSTAENGSFRDIDGERGEMQNHLKVYGREGEECPACDGEIKKIKVGGRGTYFCPKCQN